MSDSSDEGHEDDVGGHHQVNAAGADELLKLGVQGS